MKNKFDITLRTLHVGDCRRVVTLDINGKDEASACLKKLHKDDRNKWDSINTRIATVSNYLQYSNSLTFKPVGGGIFEFKRPGLRLYAFYDEIGDEHQLIICTNGGTKNTKKGQQSDISRAEAMRKTYLAAKSNPNTQFRIKEKP